jgi:outer membrane immunogenic protein
MSKIKASLLALSTLLVSSVAAAAADRFEPVPIGQWSGFYMGISGGYGWGNADYTPTGDYAAAPNPTLKPEGGLIGGQIGMDFDVGHGMIWGVVGDMSWADMKDRVCVDTSGLCGTVDPGRSDAKANVEWFGTVRGKFGAGLQSTQLYLTGGLALAGAKATVTNIDGVTDFSDTNTLVGWTIGAGVLYKATENISIGGEYLYADFGKQNYDFSGGLLAGSVSGGASVDLDMHVIRGSLNYYF